MSPERLCHIEELYHSAKERQPQARAAYLAEACPDDPELRAEVESLLALESESLFDRPAWEHESLTARVLTPGSQIGPYRVAGTLGSGGMGVVYRAHDPRLRRDVAIKFLSEELARDPHSRARFEREARAVAALNHPNICTLHDVGPDYLVMEFIEGETLATTLKKGPLSIDRTLKIAIEVAAGLAAAHNKGIIHRDLKPGNIMLTRDGRVKILDFGLAKMRSPSPAASAETVTIPTESGAVMGTAGYMSPEQIRGLEADHRSDIFSFGLILYELLVGQRAFQRETRAETMTAILEQDLPELPGSVPSGLRQVVSHCVEKDAANRFQSACDLGFALSAIALSSSGATSSALPARPGWSGRPWVAAVAAVVLLAAGAAAAVFWWRAPPPPAWTGIRLGGPEYARHPRLSPDGHTLAFDALIDDVPQVGVMKPESGNWVILTHATDKGYNQVPSWSPDGTEIYYDRWTDVPRGIYRVPVLGGPEQLVLEDAGYPEALPDGSLLAVRYGSQGLLQLIHFWPETGRVQWLPVSVLRPPRASADGRKALLIGTLIGPGQDTREHAYVVDIASGKVRPLLAGSQGRGISISSLAMTHDGKSFLAAVTADNLSTVTAIARNSRGLTPLLTLTSGVISMDAAADGSIYLDQQEMPGELVRFSAQGGHAERIATLPSYELPGSPHDEGFAVLPDGRAVVTEGAGSRSQLMAVEAGKQPVPLINTAQATSAPVTAAGPSQIAFLIGGEPWRTIALAAASNGRVLRRIPFDQGAITSLASSPDGRTLYGAAGGNIWSIPAEGGPAKKIRAGDHVAVDPAGKYLLVVLTENPVIRLIQVPLNGGPEREIPRRESLRAVPLFGPNAIGKDGRILMPLGASTWNWPPGVLDPSTGQSTRIPVDLNLDYHVLNWTPDGKVLALGMRSRSQLWKFQPRAAGK